MAACATKPADQRTQLRLVGNDLLKHHGKKKYYSVQQVKSANLRQKIDVDLHCWSHAFFNSHADFDALHQHMGEACNYQEMKKEMIDAVSCTEDSSWFDFDLSWLEFPDIEWSIFEFIDF